jgi:hypothetical protein
MKHTWMSIALSVGLAVVALAFQPGLTAHAADEDIVFSEIAPNSICLGSDPAVCGSSGSEDRFEWVEIYNKGAAAVNLSGWQICDLGGIVGCDPLPDQTILPGEYWLMAFNTTGLQTEFDQYAPARTVLAARTISLNTAIGSGLRHAAAEGIYLINNLGQDVTCVSWGATNTLCSTRTTLGSKLDTALQPAESQSIANIAGSWYLHGPTGGPGQVSPYEANTGLSGPSAITLNDFSAANHRVEIAFSLVGLGLIALLGSIVAARRQKA